jgi:hypothetical protein
MMVGVLAVWAALAAATLQYDAPKEWVVQPPNSSMRVAEFVLPRAQGDGEDASLVIYFFQGGGGSVQANLERWTSQMVQPDGRPSSRVAKTSALTAHGLAITVLDIAGTYTAEMMPGSGSTRNKPNFRLKAAVVETPGGPYFVKLTGPRKTVDRWDASVGEFLTSLRFE